MSAVIVEAERAREATELLFSCRRHAAGCLSQLGPSHTNYVHCRRVYAATSSTSQQRFTSQKSYACFVRCEYRSHLLSSVSLLPIQSCSAISFCVRPLLMDLIVVVTWYYDARVLGVSRHCDHRKLLIGTEASICFGAFLSRSNYKHRSLSCTSIVRVLRRLQTFCRYDRSAEALDLTLVVLQTLSGSRARRVP